MNIGLLNVRIEIEKSSVQTDSIGNHKNEWQPYYTCSATVSASAGAGSEDSTAGLTVDNNKLDFTIRYCRKAEAITSTEYRVRFAGELYNILVVDHMNYRRKCLKLRCQKVRR